MKAVGPLAAGALAAVLLLVACGGDGADGDELTVAAAASLTSAFERYAATRPGDVRFSFAGSDRLAAQIRRGAHPDVYAAADPALTQALREEGLVGRPIVFATGTLVLAVPDGSEIDSVEDLEEPGVDVVVGAPSVPVGSYTRALLGRLEAESRAAIAANVRSEEPDVGAIVGKLTQGAADAGFVYESDAVAAGDHLEPIALPAALTPEVAYAAAVVEGAPNPGRAERFIRGLLTDRGARALEKAGLDPVRRRRG